MGERIMNKEQVCSTCGGDGKSKLAVNNPDLPCVTCKGTGKKPIEHTEKCVHQFTKSLVLFPVRFKWKCEKCGKIIYSEK